MKLKHLQLQQEDKIINQRDNRPLNFNIFIDDPASGDKNG
jgi:hypothetical protein